MLSLSLVCLPFLALGFFWLSTQFRRKKEGLLPPGPRADPFIGHVRQVPADRPWLTYMKWGKEYGTDFLHLNFLGQSVVVLNSAEASTALLEKRSTNYSGRPRLHCIEEQGWPPNHTMGIIDTGVQLKKHRKMLQRALTPNNCLPFRDAQLKESRKLVQRIISDPEDWREHMQTFATTLVLRVGYGIDVQGKDDPYVKIADKTSDALSKGGLPGGTLIDIFPFIRYLPSWFKLIPSLNFARECVPWVQKLHEVPFLYVQREMATSTANPSFTKRLLEEKLGQNSTTTSLDDSEIITETDIKGAAGSLYVAGQDTTWSTLVVFVLGLLENEKVQKKAQEELDSVLGHGNLPTFEDRDRLPYVENIIQETFRWGPVVPLTLPHRSAKEDTYNGYFIPAGSLVIANAYAMNHDDSIHSDPDRFNPNRYTPTEKGGPGEPYPTGHFGWGRRICPGLHLGSASVWIAIATMLATLEFSKPKDSDGKEFSPNPKWGIGLTSHPEPFECIIKARTAGAVALVEQD